MKKKHIILIITYLLCNTLISLAQEKTVYVLKKTHSDGENSYSNNNYPQVDENPELFANRKKIESFSSYLRSNVDVKQINRDSLTGNIFYGSFIINPQGTIENIDVKSGISPSVNKELVKALSKLKCKPGKVDNKAVSVLYRFHVPFYNIKRPQPFHPTREGRWLPELKYEVWVPEGTDTSNVNPLFTYLLKNRQYTKGRKKGKVVVQFIIDKNGKVKDIEIKKSLDEEHDQEIIRLLENMPDWMPAYKNGEPFDFFYTLPFSFRR